MIKRLARISIQLFVSASLLLLSACYTNFEPDLESTPVVCLNSLITAGEKIKVEVTRTWRYSEGTPAVNLDVYLRDAEVSLYVNDEFMEKLTLVDESDYLHEDVHYEAEYIPKEGDKIRIRAVDSVYGDAEAEVTLPYPVEIDAVTTKVTNNKSSYDAETDVFCSTFDIVLNVKFTDPATAVNYYIFEMQTYNSIRYEYDLGDEHIAFVPIAEYVKLQPDYSFEPIFSEHITPIETIISDAYGLYTVFSDRQISGKQYSLEIPVHGTYECQYSNHPDLSNKLSVDVSLCHISTPYYNYMLSLWAATEGIHGSVGDVGLSDAVFEYSNVCIFR